MIDRKLTILYGSETGTAQDLAEHIWRESKMFYFKGTVLPMDSYEIGNLINEKLVIFVCSTTGQGDEPENMKNFWKFLLRRNLPSDSLNGVQFGVLGLGDSSYTKFNFVAKRLNKRLLQLGGSSLIGIGLCDDQHDLGGSAVYNPWIFNLFEKLKEVYPTDLPKLTENPRMFRWNVQIVDEDKENNSAVKSEKENIYTTSDATAVKVLGNVRTTSLNHFQDVRLISFDCKNLNWCPGDVLVIRPRNSEESVKQLFEIFAEHELPIYPETMVLVGEIDSEMPVPVHLKRPLTLKTAATQLWDLSTIPRTRVFELLALNCENELEKEKLIEFTKPETQEDLFAYVNRPRRTILEVLGDFPHATSKLKIEILFELFQQIKPRSFSIASCVESQKLQILVAVVEYKTKLKTARKGLCSNWVKKFRRGDEFEVSIKRGTFKLPKIEDVPVVMVGPGTGLAPFRSILQKREFEKQSLENVVLFFGCRGEKNDFHCGEDLRRMEGNGMKLFCAFSRDQEDKIYVQHRIKEQSELLKDLLVEKRGYFLLAGNSKDMPTAVKSALTEAIGDESFIEEMIKTGRYQEETWG